MNGAASVTAAILCAAAVTVLRRMLLGDLAHVRATRRLSWSSAILVVLVATVAGRPVMRSASIPYNIRELAGGFPAIAAALVALVLLACGMALMSLAFLWSRQPGRFARRFVLMAAAAGTLLYILMAAAAPVESLDDVIGTPVLGIGGFVERWLRFVPLVAGPLALSTLGARMAIRRFDRESVSGLIAVLLVACASYIVVVPLAATNNIYELLRGKGGVLAACGLAGLFIGLGVGAALLGRSLASGRWRLTAMAVGIAALLVPVTWQCLVLATNPALNKYGRLFSARQFLLSPDRDHYLDDRQIFERFGLSQLGLLATLGIGAAISASVQGRPASREDAPRSHSSA